MYFNDIAQFDQKSRFQLHGFLPLSLQKRQKTSAFYDIIVNKVKSAV
jgi:hypothetical protein